MYQNACNISFWKSCTNLDEKDLQNLSEKKKTITTDRCAENHTEEIRN